MSAASRDPELGEHPVRQVKDNMLRVNLPTLPFSDRLAMNVRFDLKEGHFLDKGNCVVNHQPPAKAQPAVWTDFRSPIQVSIPDTSSCWRSFGLH